MIKPVMRQQVAVLVSRVCEETKAVKVLLLETGLLAVSGANAIYRLHIAVHLPAVDWPVPCSIRVLGAGLELVCVKLRKNLKWPTEVIVAFVVFTLICIDFTLISH